MDMVLVAVLLALLASVAFGCSDVVSGAAVRQHSAASVAFWAQLAGLGVLGVAFLSRRPGIGLGTALWGASAGVVGAVAVLAFYSALQKGPTSIVAPVSASGGLIPIAVGLAGGDSVGLVALMGVVATVAGVVVIAAADGGGGGAVEDEHTPRAVTAHDTPLGTTRLPLGTPGAARPMPVYDGCAPPAGATDHRGSIVAALLAAAGFGGFFVVLDQAAVAQSVTAGAAGASVDDTIAVAVMVQIGAIAVTSLATTRHTWACLRPSRPLLLVGSAVGLLDVVGDFSLTYAVAAGPLSLVGPLGALDPVVTVLIATVLLRERLGPLQASGVTLAVGGALAVGLG
jgi:drug/metabolite transporter (DMT)-like permease